MKFLKTNWNKLPGILFGIIIVILGLTFESDRYHSVSSLKFGADFYTEIHGVTANAASRIGEVYDLMAKGISMALVVFGCFVIFLFIALLKFPKAASNAGENKAVEFSVPATTQEISVETANEYAVPETTEENQSEPQDVNL